MTLLGLFVHHQHAKSPCLLQVSANCPGENLQEAPSSTSQVEDQDGWDNLVPGQAHQQPQHKQQDCATR